MSEPESSRKLTDHSLSITLSNNASHPLYEKTPLTKEKKQIRLLYLDVREYLSAELHKHNPDKHTIRSYIKVVNIQDNAEYIALSYAWGDPQDVSPLQIDGENMLVTTNLLSALSSIARSQDTPYGDSLFDWPHIPIWADAICIDQGNSAEKSHQVSQMRTVYEKATMVICFLGAITNATYAALNFLPELAAADNDTAKSLLKDPSKVPMWRAIFALLERPWFRRLWIIQEFALAKTKYFMCGDQIIDAEHVVAVEKTFQRLRSTVEFTLFCRDVHDFSDIINNLVWIYGIQGLINGKQRSPIELLYRLIFLTESQLCFEPRDRIYALFGLITSSEVDPSIHQGSDLRSCISTFYPDYAKPQSRVWKEIFELYVRITGNISLISFANMDSELDLSLPSWTPRWTSDCSAKGVYRVYPDVVDKITLEGNIPHSIRWHASRDFPAKHKFSEDFDAFFCHGFQVDTVEHVHDMVKSETTWSSTVLNELFYNWYTFSEALLRKAGYRFDQVFDLFWRTVTADHIYVPGKQVLRPAPEEFKTILNLIMLGSGRNPGDERFLLVLNQIATTCGCRRLYVTKGGRLGLGPMRMQERDIICILYGGITPYVLRKADRQPEKYIFIGDTFVHGLMYGEGLNGLEKGEYYEEEFGIY
jgi:hypothetical protein